MFVGVMILLLISLIYSYVSFEDYRKDRLETLKTIAENIAPDIAKDLSNQSLEALRVRMEFIVLKEQERNIQIKITDPSENVVYQSDEFDWNCHGELKGVSEKVPLCAEKNITSSEGNLGRLQISRDVRTFFSFFMKSNMPVLFLILLAFLSLLVVMFRYLIRREVINPMNQLISNLEENIAFDEKVLSERANEWTVLSQSILEYKEKIINYIKKQNQMSKDLEKEKLVSEITAQLAHDIRSPLAALDMMAGNMDELDHNKRNLIRNATARIHNIAHNLLDRSFQKNNNISTQMFSSLIRSMLFEKREQYKSNPKISIHEHVAHKSYGAFAKIDINDFKRMLSNLIDNAVEAIPSTGFVRVALSQGDDFVVIEVFDNGKGIPADELHKVTEKGFTKRNEGSGLGLYFVYQKLKEWGGRLEIESTVNQGTSVKMIIRKEPPPAWFVSEIRINDEDEYVVLDDDFSIHEMWKNKVLQAVRRNIKMKHFEDEQSFREWFISHRDQKRKTTYFFDYELLGNKNSGLDIIEKYKINSDAILITSHYEDEEIQRRCERIGVKMIPKEMAGFVPVIAQA
ncbi:MAG: HAMP domain-containing sensor histidine kinase [Bdellovibrionota bacterium]